MTQEEYAALLHAGADSFTMYQETYDEKVYCALHTGGPKADYQFRLDAPARAAAAGMRTVTLGPLLGLADPVREAFFCGLHARYMQKNFPSVEVAVSFPRLRPMAGEFEPAFVVDDRQFVQFILAARIFLPQCGITVSTRESQQLRDSIVNLGITKMSAGVSTAVGGHSEMDESTAQFEIADSRSLDKLKSDLCAKGLQPVTHDWNSKFVSVRSDETCTYNQ
jgi:2-iminoacetate synthase